MWVHVGFSNNSGTSRYFYSLERKNYIEKTIRKLHKANGEVITHQAGILSEIRSFYTDLYRSRDHLLSDIDLLLLEHLITAFKKDNSQSVSDML